MKYIIKLFFLHVLVTPIIVYSQDSKLETWREQGEKYRAESKFDSALIVFQKVALQAQTENNLEYQMRAAMGMAAVYVETRKSELAIKFYRQASLFAKRSGDISSENRALYGIGVAHQTAGKLDSALYYYDLTKDSFVENNNREMGARVRYQMATLLRTKKEYIEANVNAMASARLHREIKDYRWEGNSYYLIGSSFMSLEEFDSSFHYFQKAFEIADSLNYPDNKGFALNGLARLSQRRGDFESAYYYMRDYYEVSRNIFTEENNDKLVELQEKYNAASFELEAEKQKNLRLREERIKNTILIIGISLVVIISIWLYVVDQRRKNIKAIAAKNDEINKQKIDELLQQQEIASLQGVLEGQETERKRVAIDLHDRLGGILSMVKLHFSAVEEKIDPENPTKEKFLTASELLDLAAGEVRNISHNMMSGVLAKFGLIPALEDLKSRISETGKLQVNLYTSNINGSLDGEQELQLYRIVQELMSNILKHSDATETNIQLNENEDNVNLIVEDDGVGFNPEKLDVNAGIGLNNLKARVSKLNGTLHIDSGLGAGTTISIDIPVEND